MKIGFLFNVFIIVVIVLVLGYTQGCSRSIRISAALENEGFRCDTPVSTGTGLVRGEADKGGKTCSWKGVQYAAPPVGPLRWRPPQPVEPWSGIRDATHWGSICPQSGWLIFLNFNTVGTSEDCLYLNIWRPRKRGKFPVMVWIHGGGYFCGTGATPMYFGDRLSANGDVVVVSINYRLNAFGFLSHDKLAEEDPHGSSGNYGTMDQVEALRWVHDNIASFGGDPDNVTIFGESAGGWSVCTLLATPLARGLFHRAIIESGGCEATWSMERGCEDGRWAAGRLGCAADDVECMRGKDTGEVLDWLEPFPLWTIIDRHFSYINHEDGYVLTGTPLSTIRSGEFNNVPLLAGSNRDEVSPLLLLKPWGIFMTKSMYGSRIQKEYGSYAETILKLYPADSYQNPAQAYMAILSDRILTCPTYEGVRAVSRHQNSTYYYRFDYDEMRFGGWLGAMHGMEVPFVFKSFDRAPVRLLYDLIDKKKAMELADIIQHYWVNFAYTGNPNGPGLPEWPTFRLEDSRVQVLDTDVNTQIPYNADRCAFWAEYNLTHPSFLKAGGLGAESMNKGEAPDFPSF